MTKEQEYAFKMGWCRSRSKINHASRRQFRKAAVEKGLTEEFATGWYIQKFLGLMFTKAETKIEVKDFLEDYPGE